MRIDSSSPTMSELSAHFKVQQISSCVPFYQRNNTSFKSPGDAASLSLTRFLILTFVVSDLLFVMIAAPSPIPIRLIKPGSSKAVLLFLFILRIFTLKIQVQQVVWRLLILLLL
ncbi:hypothetical protein TNIN_132801 [Trichonephila inaurata madagascariensis]|uniref:Uncharacterized protein n=1 Tax=Trichonephila inaurata madagascariensis TaxID=2747483 RepID=A0A8X7CT79_9ARAC|nr:hypothetical protein TNIN_132801 [Trichonephila inaurata madagascariensis]